MADRTKAIKGLECCVRSGNTGKCPDECPYYKKCWEDDDLDDNLADSLHKDALELLKEQPEQKFFVDSDGKMTPLPVQKHGHWVETGKSPPFCSECDHYAVIVVGESLLSDYCPWCGAKMDGEEKKNAAT